MTTTAHPTSRQELTRAARDFEAAMHEVDSNLEVRRLMFVLSNVLVPTCLVALADCLTGSDYPTALRWLPEHVLPLVGGILLVAGVLVTGILTRCHFGLVVNGTKMAVALHGPRPRQGLNWLGVTTNFVALTALSSSLGALLLLAGLGQPVAAVAVAASVPAVALLWLWWNHVRAHRLCASLQASWQTGAVPASLREAHARRSLDATTSDVSVIVVMAVALFAGGFNSLTNVGGIASDLTLVPSAATLQDLGVSVLSGFLLASLMLSGRMVVRLRIALAQHAEVLAALREEQDTPWRFRPQERTYLLFVTLHALTVAVALMFVWHLAGATAGLLIAAGVALGGLGWYPWALARAARRRA